MLPCLLGEICLLVLSAVLMLFKIKLSFSYNLRTLLEVRTRIDIYVLVFNISVISAEELGDEKKFAQYNCGKRE